MGVRDTIAKALMGMIGGPNKLGRGGIDVYHSSPHDFERFDLKKIGTGEGAQVYGHGLYFAENPAVSGQGGQYWKQFLGKFQGTPEGEAARELMQSGFDRQKAIGYLERDLASKRELGLDPMNPAFAQTRVALERLTSGAPVGPRTYEVNINADPVKFLDWDKPVKGQPVFDAVAGSRNKLLRDVLGRTDTGENLYKALSYDTGVWQKGRGAAEALNEAGIPGIKYLDEGSRALPQGTVMGAQQTPQGWVSSIRGAHPSSFNGGTIFTKSMPFPSEVEALQWATDKVATKPTSNYVVFDPSIIDIAKKYGIAGAVAAPVLGSAFDQGQYREAP